jgi:hypothetical protein
MIDLKALALQLRGAATQLDELAAVFGGIGGTSKKKGRTGTRRPMSPAARAKISAAQKKRWSEARKKA